MEYNNASRKKIWHNLLAKTNKIIILSTAALPYTFFKYFFFSSIFFVAAQITFNEQLKALFEKKKEEENYASSSCILKNYKLLLVNPGSLCKFLICLSLKKKFHNNIYKQLCKVSEKSSLPRYLKRNQRLNLLVLSNFKLKNYISATARLLHTSSWKIKNKLF